MYSTDFYDFDGRLVLTTASVEIDDTLQNKNDSYNKFDLSYALSAGRYDNITFPVIFRQIDGKVWRDLLDRYVPLFLISDRLKAVLEENGFTGWQTFPVKVFDKKGQEIEGYHGFSVTGRCGSRDFSQSEIIEKPFGRTNGKIEQFYKGLYVDLDTWDGSYFFMFENYYGTFITPRVMKILKAHKFTNVRFKHLTDYEIPLFMLK